MAQERTVMFGCMRTGCGHIYKLDWTLDMHFCSCCRPDGGACLGKPKADFGNR